MSRACALVRRAGIAALLLVVLSPAGAARAQQGGCPRVVVVALPGITWADVARYRPPALLDAAAEGAKASVSVRTNTARTSYASGFATIGGGARLDGGGSSGGLQAGPDGRALTPDGGDGIVAGGVDELQALADEEGYDARPGALATALEGRAVVAAIGNADPGRPPPVPVGRGRWSLLAAMNDEGRVGFSVTEPEVLDDDASAPFGVRANSTTLEDAIDDALGRCAVVIVDPGDLERADEAALTDPEVIEEERVQALAAADALVGHVASALDPDVDLLLVVSPTSPWWKERAQLGVAIARGPGYPPGATLVSASTRRTGFVTLPDVAPTILEFLDVERPAAMNGRPWDARPAGPGESLDGLVEENEEAVFVDSVQSKVSTGFVIFQAIVYALAIALLASRRRSLGRIVGLLEGAALWIAAFPVSTYLMGALNGHALGTGWFVLVLAGLALAMAAVLSVSLRDPLDRLLAISAFTVGVIAVDLFLGARLQIETVFGYSPTIAGRFAGIGNIAFAVLAAAGVLTGTLLVHRWRGRGALLATGLLFAGVVVLDGAPQLGSDVGGVLALVPGLGITFMLLSGRRPSWRTLVVTGLVALAFVAVFLVIDLSRPPGSQTHLARLFEDVRTRGFGPLGETIMRKAEANLRVFRSTIWTFLVPPALGVLGLLLLRPRGRWRELASTYPKPWAGLVGGLVLAVLAFAVNDSGIVIPAVILSFLVPMALIVHLLIESSTTDSAA